VSRVPPGVALPSGQGDPDKDRPPNHGPPRARTAADDSTEMRSDAPNDRRNTPAYGAVASKKDGLPIQPEAWRSLLAPTRHLYKFPVPVRTPIIPLPHITVITQTSGTVSCFQPDRLHPNGTRPSAPRPEDADRAAATQPRPTTHPFVAARLNPNRDGAVSRNAALPNPPPLCRRPLEPETLRRGQPGRHMTQNPDRTKRSRLGDAAGFDGGSEGGPGGGGEEEVRKVA